MSSYMDYHPGGWDELMKGAGKDATDLFNEVHRWVNYESMLKACLVGKLVSGERVAATFRKEERKVAALFRKLDKSSGAFSFVKKEK